MLFKSGDDIQHDIKNRISCYLKDNDVNIKTLSSILSVYLQELKNIDEIYEFGIFDINDDTNFNVYFLKESISYKFNISIVVEMRNIKIEKIKNNNS